MSATTAATTATRRASCWRRWLPCLRRPKSAASSCSEAEPARCRHARRVGLFEHRIAGQIAVREHDAAACVVQRRERCRAPQAGHREAHRMAEAAQVDALDLGRQVRVGAGEVVEHELRPVLPGLAEQLGAARLGQGEVGRQQRRLRRRVERLVARVDIAERDRAIADVVPGGRGAGAQQQRRAQQHIGREPGGMRLLQRLQRGGWLGQQARRDEQRRGHDDGAGRPALRGLGRLVPGQGLDAMPALGHAQHGAAEVDAVAQRLGDAGGQPAIALRPGQHRLPLGGLVARGVEAVAAGEIVQAGPGGHGGGIGAEVVAAAVVEVPAQAGVAQALGVEPCREGLRVEPVVAGCPAGAVRGHRETEVALRLGHQGGEAAVLGQPGRAVGRGQQAFMPGAVEEQSLLRAVAQVPFVPLGTAEALRGQAQLVQQLQHLAGVGAGHRQVVGAKRAGRRRQSVAAAVAAGLVLQVEQRDVVHAAPGQGSRAGQAGDAGADDQHAGRIDRAVGRRQRAAQPVAAFRMRADPAALQRGGLARAAGQGGSKGEQ
mmetsp:Transcript_6203/g.25063  ORF Transcript_6203/g.25063 Transcript_6203/m.25063 type:complete len:545 (-) Transcript_6203:80-1714(-)